MNDQILDVLQKKHGIGVQVKTKVRCHSCGEPISEGDVKKPASYDFPNGLHVQFCDEDELNDWKQRNNIE